MKPNPTPLFRRSRLCTLCLSAGLFVLAPAQAEPIAEAAVEFGSVPASPPASTPATETPTRLAPLIVTGNLEPRSELDQPAAVGRIDATVLHEGLPQLSLAESLARVPGLDVRERNNYAQDLQIQSRGFGARSSFGVRGVQLRLDGFPVTAPDGQGQSSGFLVSALDRIEILRGPLAFPYGNSAGGVVAAWSAPPPERTELRVQLGGGSDDTWRGALQAGGTLDDGRLGYRAELLHFRTDGLRPQSEAQRTLATLVGRAELGDGRTLSVLVNSVSQPDAQDPLGLTRAQFDADPRQTAPQATTFDTRKSLEDRMAGLRYEQRLDGGDRLELSAYGSTRAVEQFLAIPASAQAAPTSAGGVIDLDRRTLGAEARYLWRMPNLDLSLGLQAQVLDEDRHGYENFAGTELGVRGALRRDEVNRMVSIEPSLLAEWRVAPDWLAVGALRQSWLRFESDDRYVRDGNPDDSGERRFDEATLAAALQYRIDDRQRVYLSAGEGYETPTANELSYRPDGGSGFNDALDAARSRTLELGWKRSIGARGLLALAAYRTAVDGEIVPALNSGGRSSFQNADTRRRGAEASIDLAVSESWNAYLAADWIDARFDEAYTSISAGTPSTVAEGNRVPGVARRKLFAELAWRRGREGWSGALDARYADDVPVNDLNTDAASAYTVASARLVYTQRATWGGYSAFLRGENLFDREYAGSVIVNEGNGRFFEPAAGRAWFAGVELRFTP